MAASKPPKALLISQLMDQLKSVFPDAAEVPRLELVDSVLFAILRENRNSADALATLAQIKRDYDDDFNELRVSSLREIAQKIGPGADSEARAQAIRAFLHQIFNKNYKFQIDGIAKKPFKEAKDELKGYQALANDHHMAYVQVQSLNGHAFPVDARILETARRLGIVDQSADAATLRGLLEKNIPKAQIHQSIAVIERFVNVICTAESPRCTECPFQKICPYLLNAHQAGKPAKADKPASAPKKKSEAVSVAVDDSKPRPTAQAPAAKTKPGTTAPAPNKAKGSVEPKVESPSKGKPDKPAAKADSLTKKPPVVEAPATKQAGTERPKAAAQAGTPPAASVTKGAVAVPKPGSKVAAKPAGKANPQTEQESATKQATANSTGKSPVPKKPKKQ